jgi:hypothetical protein
VLTYAPGLEEENYYASESYDDGFSPSPPRASGGAYYPDTHIPPPGGYSQQTSTGYPPHQQYNPVDYGGHPPQPPVEPYPYPSPRTREGENVSATRPHHSESLVSLDIPTPQSRYIREGLDEEGASITNLHLSPLTSNSISKIFAQLSSNTSPGSISSLSSSTPRTPSPPPNKSVTFAPLSPGPSHHLAYTRKYQRRNSDPSSDRHNTPRKHRRRYHNPTRSPSPIVDGTVEELPPRFDKDGRPLGRELGEGPEVEMVERIVNDFKDVLEGRQTWRSLLRSFWEERRTR